MVPPEPPGPTPIPVEGDIQIFADPECTTYADGTQETVYARVNVPWTEEKTYEGDWPLILYVFNQETPNVQFSIELWGDWYSDLYSNLVPGIIIPCKTEPGMAFDEPQPGIDTIY